MPKSTTIGRIGAPERAKRARDPCGISADRGRNTALRTADPRYGDWHGMSRQNGPAPVAAAARRTPHPEPVAGGCHGTDRRLGARRARARTTCSTTRLVVPLAAVRALATCPRTRIALVATGITNVVPVEGTVRGVGGAEPSKGRVSPGLCTPSRRMCGSMLTVGLDSKVGLRQRR
jgi:hypothetical protein